MNKIRLLLIKNPALTEEIKRVKSVAVLQGIGVR